MLYLSVSIKKLIKKFEFEYFVINKCKNTEKCFIHSNRYQVLASPTWDIARSKNIKRLFLRGYIETSKITLTSVYEYFEDYYVIKENVNIFQYEIALFKNKNDMLKFKLSENVQDWEWVV